MPAGSSREVPVAVTLCWPAAPLDDDTPSPATTASSSVAGSSRRMTLSPVSFPGRATAAGSEKSEM